MFAQFMLDATLEAFMYGHALAFQALGDVPRAVATGCAASACTPTRSSTRSRCAVSTSAARPAGCSSSSTATAPFELDRAIAEALTRGTLSAASVAHLLDQRVRARHALPPLDTVLLDDPRVRDLRVAPHALARYDELYAAPAAEDAPSPAVAGDDQEGSS